MKAKLIVAPTAAPNTGIAWTSDFCVTVMLNLAATFAINDAGAVPF
jgi:hypothetical protein